MSDIGQTPLLSGPGGFPWHTGNLSNYAIDASDKKLAWIMQSLPSGPTITKVALRPAALTGTSPTYRVSLQGVDASGNPDGTIKSGSGSNDVYVDITPAGGDAGTYKEYTFGGSGYNSSPGEMLAVVVAVQSGTCDGSNNWSFGAYFGDDMLGDFPHSSTYNGAAWAKQFHYSAALISDGTAWWGGIPFIGNSNACGNLGYSGNNNGVKFTIPAGVADTLTCIGCRGRYYVPPGSSYTIKLYDESDSLLVDTVIDSDFHGYSYGYSGTFLWDDTPPVLSAGSTYRLVTTANLYCRQISASHRNQLPWAGLQTFTYGDVGSWTDKTDIEPYLMPVFSDITAPAGGGGGLIRHPGMTGGING